MAESIDFLVGAGHRLEDLKRYTVRGIHAFVLLSHDRQSRELRDTAYIMRSAYHADGKAFTKHMTDME